MMNKQLHGEKSQSDAVHYLRRPHIDNLLKESLQKPITTVIAGAGYGKTHAVSSALEAMRYKYAWLHLSEMDNMISILWKRLFYAVEVQNPELAERLHSLGYPSSPASYNQFLRMIEVNLRDKERFALVLDDFHSIQDKTVLGFFEKLITANIPNLSIVLISREKPSLPMAGVLSKGLMARITEDDLRFSRDEMAAYFQILGETLGAGTLSNLYAYTEGWIVAIYLLGLSLKGSVYNQSLISRARIDIFALIEEEIINAASKELQKFLSIMALLDVAPAGLLKELTMDSPEILDEMNCLSLLIWYDPHSDYYQMHRLLKDFLSERKTALTNEEINRTHLIAARWYHDHNQLEEAVSHYWECDCYSKILDILLSVRTHVPKDTADLFVNMIQRLPDEIIDERPIIRVVKAQFLFNNNRIREAQDELNLICEEYEVLPPAQEHLAVLGEVYILLALISITKQNLEFVTLFKKADKCLPNGSTLINYQRDIAEGMNVTGIMNPISGELKRYRDALFEAAPYGARVMNGCGYGLEYLNATDAAFMTGDIRGAEKFAYETINRAQLKQQHGIEFMANFYLMRIFFFRGDYTQIALILRQMREQMERPQNADCMALYDIVEGWFFVKIGQPAKVANWILREEETRMVLAPVVLGREYLVRSDCLLAEGKYLELLGFMKQTDVLYEERGVLYALIQNKITESIIYHYLDGHRESMNALQTAYHLSHANNLVMQYIEYGSKMRTVIHSAIQDQNCTIPKEWLENIGTKSSTYAKRLNHIVKSYNTERSYDKQDQINLTERELEVLSCLCHGLKRDEIADACYLSASSVKRIQKSIYSKLGAINSLDAVRIATKMNLT